MFSSLSQSSAALPPSHTPSPGPDAKLPRGECGFLLAETDARGARQRCTCRSFYPSDERVRSLCGCGHQAWHHEAQPLSSVSVEEHMAVVQELQKMRRNLTTLEHNFALERRRHAEVERTWNSLHAKQYQNMKYLKIELDDKVEGVMDKSTENSDALNTLNRRVDIIDELTMDLENRMERINPGGGRQSRSLTPVLEAPVVEKPVEEPMHDVPRELPIRSFERRKPPSTWSARVVFVPRKSQRYVFEHDSLAMRRCLSRGLQQEITFSGTDNATFVNTIEAAFRQIIRGRSWMPLVGYRPEDEPFSRIMLCTLAEEQLRRNLWDHHFIDHHCVAHDKLQGDLLYVALTSEDLSWTEIKWLAPVLGADDTCWCHDEELDGPTKGAYKSLDEQVMYDYSYSDPPPYSSRTHSEMSRRITGLDVLANASALHPHAGHSADAVSIRSASERSLSEASMSAPSISGLSMGGRSERSLPTSSLDSIMSDNDSHRDKKIRTKNSLFSLDGGSSSGSTAPSLYVSGRSKRKLSNNAKVKEPLHINVSSWTPMRTIRSMQANKDKGGDASSR